MTFDECFQKLIGHEGGYVNNPKDPGGETKYGISQRAYPNTDIKNLSLKQAKAIYYTDYFIPSGAERAPDAVKFDLFDAAVNSGVIQAKRWLQQAAGVTADGVLGPVSWVAIEEADPLALHARYNGARLQFMTDLSTWPSFGKGWARRIAANLSLTASSPI